MVRLVPFKNLTTSCNRPAFDGIPARARWCSHDNGAGRRVSGRTAAMHCRTSVTNAGDLLSSDPSCVLNFIVKFTTLVITGHPATIFSTTLSAALEPPTRPSAIALITVSATGAMLCVLVVVVWYEYVYAGLGLAIRSGITASTSTWLHASDASDLATSALVDWTSRAIALTSTFGLKRPDRGARRSIPPPSMAHRSAASTSLTVAPE
mmetsp:Transcript_25922/g.78004  ORF Transcript_25922/g.78004 Transcript_25922/m.78004 type:complete len:208 (-) Transcript_25922:1053-1676(-)